MFVVREHDLRAAPMQSNAEHCFVFQSLDFTLHVASQLHTSSQLSSYELFSPNLTSFQLLSSHLLFSQMSPKFFSATFISSERTLTSLRQMALAATQARASNYIFLLQDLNKTLPSTTLYYKACTKHVPVLFCTTNKACTKHVPVLLCTTKLAQSTSQYYFVLQSLHKVLPSTT